MPAKNIKQEIPADVQTDAAPAAVSSTKKEPKAKQPKTEQDQKPKAPKQPKAPKAPKESSPSKDTVEGEKVEKKLSAVPMPLVKKVREQLNADQAPVNFKNMNELKSVLETFVKVIVDTTSNGDNVTLPNFMTFKRVLRNERTHKNPMTKEQIIKPAHYVLSMYVKAHLKKDFEQLEVQSEDLEKLNKAKMKKEKTV
jgi:nucleoid DNA-binding protein